MSDHTLYAEYASQWPHAVSSVGNNVVLDSDAATGDAVAGAVGSSVTVAASFDTTGLWDPQFFCVWQGQVFPWGDALQPATTAPPEPGSTNPSTNCLDGVVCLSDLSGCFKDAGFDLYSPSTWVDGALKDGVCIAQWLFIPKSINAATLTSPVTGTVPGLWIGDAVDAVTTLKTQLSASAAGSACDAPGVNTGDLSSLHAPGQSFGFTLPAPSSLGCTPIHSGSTWSNLGDFFGYRVILRDVMRLGLWFGVLVIVWRMTPWGRRTPMTVGSGLNLEGEDVETVWTNETVK
jgi:hypothetical protein